MDPERLAAVVHAVNDAIIVIDDDARIRLFNAAAQRLFGCSEHDAIGTPLERFVAPQLRVPFRAGIERWRHGQMQAADLSMPSVWRGLRSTGDSFPCEVTIAPCHVAGTPELVISVRDITTRRQSANVNRHQSRFETFLFELSRTFTGLPDETIDASLTDGLAHVGTFLEMDRVTLLELSPDHTKITVAYNWNRSGVTRPAPALTTERYPWWLGRVLRGEASLMSGVDDLPESAVAEREYLQDKSIASMASIPLRFGGEIAGVIAFITANRRVAWTPELVTQLRTIGDVLWNAFKRHQAMQKLLAARQVAHESEARFRLIANTAPVMIWMSDIDKQISYVNQRWFDFTGWPPHVAPGHRWIELLHPDEVERCGRVYVSAFEQHQPFDVEHRLRHHSGEYRWVVTTGAPRRSADGSFLGYVGTAVDVTDRKLGEVALLESHAALIERTNELEHRTAQLRQMASDLTLAEQRARETLAKTLHDGLQQLLVVVAISLEGLITRRAHQDTMMGTLQQAKNHLDEAMTAARSLSIELYPPVLHSSGLPTALRWLAEWSNSRYGLEVVVSADPRANSDRKDVRTLLFESVRELIFNVVKHADVERVTLDLAPGPDDTICITVADQGRGFDVTEFDRRTRVGEVGWGLFSIRERLELLGGRFEIESTPGRGSTFRLIAPRDIARASAQPATHHATVGASERQLRIMIADDHSAMRESIRDLLHTWPEFQVVGEVANGVEAIEQAHALRPDVILMDVSMPEMDGIEATGRIRAELPSIQVLGFSMHPRTREPHAVERAGAAGFFTKGVDTQRLIAHLRTMAR